MTIRAGVTLGHYTIAGLLGTGGMGEVWGAEDTTLKRKVELKVLPLAVAADLDRLARFQREAEVVAGGAIGRGTPSRNVRRRAAWRSGGGRLIASEVGRLL